MTIIAQSRGWGWQLPQGVPRGLLLNLEPKGQTECLCHGVSEGWGLCRGRGTSARLVGRVCYSKLGGGLSIDLIRGLKEHGSPFRDWWAAA